MTAPKSRHTETPTVGGFVRTALGIGRLVAVDAVTGNVRYFAAPGRAPYVERTHRIDELAPTSLPTHTRAYVYDGRRWRIGRIEGPHPQDPDRYLVAFPNNKGDVLSHEAFDVRWSAPISDPFAVLESVGGDSPVVYESRLALLHAWTRQRAAAAGAEGLLLGSIELHRHQLEVVRRVAADPVKRYLLADEVGLGKTIEAGALIWQYLAARPAARVLVVAPEHLRRQWEHELLGRFRIDHYPEAWLRIRSQADERSWPDEPVDMLVIDEAHHVTRGGPLPASARDKVARLAHAADAVLLLSATPVRSNEAGFLDLLHLLDPHHYRPEKLEDFVKRVELRDQLALTYQALEPDLDAFDLSLYADQLKALFPDDMMLAAMVADATAADDERRPAQVVRLRNHLSETYRLHHRVVRTRRTPDVGATFAVRGRRRAVPFTLDVADRSDALRRELLDSVRAHLAAAVESGDLATDDAVDALRDIAARCGSLSHSLLAVLDRPPEDAQPPPRGTGSWRWSTRTYDEHGGA